MVAGVVPSDDLRVSGHVVEEMWCACGLTCTAADNCHAHWQNSKKGEVVKAYHLKFWQSWVEFVFLSSVFLWSLYEKKLELAPLCLNIVLPIPLKQVLR